MRTRATSPRPARIARSARLRLGAALAAVVLAACATPSPSGTDGPSESAHETSPTPAVTPLPSSGPTSVSAAPSPTPTPTTTPLARDAVAQVSTTDLLVRSLPEISDASEIYAPALDEPTYLLIVDGPVSADGYEWYQVQPFGIDALDPVTLEARFGWVAAGSRDGTEAWIAPATLECPGPTIESIVGLSPEARLACYGQESLTIEGEFTGCGIADPSAIDPAWFFQTACTLNPFADEPGTAGLQMRFELDPGIPHDQPGAGIRVTGHFDDAAALTCRPVELGDDAGSSIEPMEPGETIVFCRSQFVVTEVTVLEG